MKLKNYKKGNNFLALFGVLFLSLGLFAGVLIIQSPQNIEEKAASSYCPGAEACPYSRDPSLLISCHPSAGTSTVNSLCNPSFKGRRETCGSLTTYYCCNGSVWTLNQSACATPPPTPTVKPTPTATPTATPTPVANCLNPNLNSNPWDVDRNGTVNIIDIGIVIDYYGKDPCIYPRADIDGKLDATGKLTIDIVDIGLMTDHYSF
jgi:hypothetical protein